MIDIALLLTDSSSIGMTVENNDLATEDGLKTAVLISLYTDRRVTREELPDEETSLRGCWTDVFEEEGDKIGSKLWLLERQKITTEVLRKFRQYCEEALEWLIDDKIAQSVEVAVEKFGLNEVAIETVIRRSNAQGTTSRFSFVWNGT